MNVLKSCSILAIMASVGFAEQASAESCSNIPPRSYTGHAGIFTCKQATDTCHADGRYLHGFWDGPTHGITCDLIKYKNEGVPTSFEELDHDGPCGATWNSGTCTLDTVGGSGGGGLNTGGGLNGGDGMEQWLGNGGGTGIVNRKGGQTVHTNTSGTGVAH